MTSTAPFSRAYASDSTSSRGHIAIIGMAFNSGLFNKIFKNCLPFIVGIAMSKIIISMMLLEVNKKSSASVPFEASYTMYSFSKFCRVLLERISLILARSITLSEIINIFLLFIVNLTTLYFTIFGSKLQVKKEL